MQHFCLFVKKWQWVARLSCLFEKKMAVSLHLFNVFILCLYILTIFYFCSEMWIQGAWMLWNSAILNMNAVFMLHAWTILYLTITCDCRLLLSWLVNGNVMLKRKELLVLVVSPYTYLCYLKHEDFLWNASLFISKNIMYLFMCSFELQLLWETKSQLLQVAFWDVAEDSEC